MIKALKITTSIIALAVSVNAASTHCTSSENVLFSCNTGKKTVSVCASKNIGPKTGYIQYRFGKIGSPEALIPSNPESFRSSLTAYEWDRASRSEGLDFENKDFSYYISVQWGRINVYKKDKSIAELHCLDNPDGTSTAIYDVDTDKLKTYRVKVEKY